MNSTTDGRQHWTFYSIMEIIKNQSSVRNMMRTYGIKKSTLNFWLKKLQEKNLICKTFQGHYELTINGTNYLDTCDAEETKNLVRLENMRYVFPIYEGLDNLLKKRRWDDIQDLKNNVKIFHTREEEFSVRVIVGTKNQSLEITCKQRIGTDIYEMMYEARRWIEFIAERINNKYSLKLGRARPSMQPEWAIPSPLAEVLLNKTNSSQIRTSYGVINKSKGRNTDIETRDIRLANKLFNLPNMIEQISNDVSRLKYGNTWNWFSF